MNARESAAHRMGTSVSNALEAITTALAFPALSAKHEALKHHLANIDAYSTAQTAPITGPTRERERAFAAAIATGAGIAGTVLSYARARKLDTLATKVDITATRLQSGRLSRRVELLQQIHEAAAGALPELADYRVTELMLADLRTQIDRLRDLVPVARDNIAARRVLTQKLRQECRALRRLIEEEIDPLVEQLRTSSSDHYTLYRAARVIVDAARGGTRQETKAAVATAAPLAQAA